jgi:tetratricopeptide (TPR) repeat protein
MPNGSDNFSYDLFLSYNSADHEMVEHVARRLRAQGLEPFLDRWYLAPGARWRPKLEEILTSSKAVAIFVGAGQMGSWQQREVDVALDLQAKNTNFPVIPVLLTGSEPPLGFLRQLTWVDFRDQLLDRAIAILTKAAQGEPPGPDLERQFESVRTSICPYRGLLYFREEDAPLFFGREKDVGRLSDAVRHLSFVAVVGASGSGKSSVVRAGLVPRLRSDRTATWEIVTLVPTDQPLKAMAGALVPLLEPTMSEVDRLAEVGKLAEHFRSGAVPLLDVLRRIRDKQRGTDRLLVFVDQFEELFTLTHDDVARRRFIDELLAVALCSESKLSVVLTLRGDFVGGALAYRPLSDRLQGAQINIGPMIREELECAILKPAEKVQLEFEPGLVQRILNDVGDEPGNLPLLEFVLKDLWEKRRGRVLLNETYDAIGGLQGAVATKADELLKDLSLADQKILQRVFLRIVRPSESGLDTRRRATFSELPAEGAELVSKLANERLLVTNKVTDETDSGLEQTVEVAHEALISNWGTLRAWIREDREFLLWRDRLGSLLKEWARAEENVDALLRGPLFVEAQKWFDQRNQDLSDEERKFISASREERERLARDERERQIRELEAAQKSASKLRRRAFLAAGAACVALILLAVSFFVWRKSESARTAAENARDQADELINFMIVDLHDKLLPIAPKGVLDDIDRKAKAYLDQLPLELVTPSRQRQQAVTLGNLGDVLVAQGKLTDALNSYEKCLAISDRLAEKDPSNVGWKHDLAVAYEKIAHVLAKQDKLADALSFYQKHLTISNQLAERDPSNSGWQHDLAVVYDDIGDVLVEQDQGKVADALNSYQKALAIFSRLAEQDVTNAARQHDLAMSYDDIAYALAKQGKLADALDTYQKALAIFSRLTDQDADWQDGLAGCYDDVGDVLGQQGKLTDALDFHQKALVIYKRLAEQDKSDLAWQDDLAGCYDDIGSILVEQGKLADALDSFQKALAISKHLVGEDATNADWQQRIIFTFYDIGTTTARIGAQDSLRQAQASLRTALNLADKYAGPDRQEIIDELNQALQDLVHSNQSMGARDNVTPKSH